MHGLARINSRDQAARLDQFLAAYSDPLMVKEADRLYQAIDVPTHAHWHAFVKKYKPLVDKYFDGRGGIYN